MTKRLLSQRMTSNLVLFSCVIILSLIIHFNPLEQPKNDNVFTQLKKTDINKIIITIPKREDVVIELKKEWHITRPIKIKANQARIENILNLLNSKTFSRFSKNDLNLNEFALSSPLGKLSFNQTEFLFGDTDPIDQQRYVLHKQTLYLIEDIVFPIISANLGSLVSTQLLPENDHIISYHSDNFTIKKNNSDHWQLSPQSATTVQHDTLLTWLNHWQNAQAAYVTRQTLSTQDKAKISIQTEHDTLDLHIINLTDQSGLYRQDRSLLYHLSNDMLQQLTSLP